METVILYLQIGMECHIFFMSMFRVIFLPWNKLLILSESHGWISDFVSSWNLFKDININQH